MPDPEQLMRDYIKDGDYKRIVQVQVRADVVYWIAHLAILGLERIRKEEAKGGCPKGSSDLMEIKVNDYYNAAKEALSKK